MKSKYGKIIRKFKAKIGNWDKARIVTITITENPYRGTSTYINDKRFSEAVDKWGRIRYTRTWHGAIRGRDRIIRTTDRRVSYLLWEVLKEYKIKDEPQTAGD